MSTYVCIQVYKHTLDIMHIGCIHKYRYMYTYMNIYIYIYIHIPFNPSNTSAVHPAAGMLRRRQGRRPWPATLEKHKARKGPGGIYDFSFRNRNCGLGSMPHIWVLGPLGSGFLSRHVISLSYHTMDLQ